MQVGSLLDEAVAEIILGIAMDLGARTFGEFRLSADSPSSYYFDGRMMTLHRKGTYYVARAFLSVPTC